MTAPAGGDRPEIPVLEVGGDWVVAALERSLPRLHALLDLATRRVPGTALRLADAASRRWPEQHRAPRMTELDRVAAIIGRPGADFFNVSCEWGCTTRAAPAADGVGAELLRVLDWPDPRLGRHVMVLAIRSPAGCWLTLTWPGYVGALQGMAPRRFSAALNQAPPAAPMPRARRPRDGPATAPLHGRLAAEPPGAEGVQPLGPPAWSDFRHCRIPQGSRAGPDDPPRRAAPIGSARERLREHAARTELARQTSPDRGRIVPAWTGGRWGRGAGGSAGSAAQALRRAGGVPGDACPSPQP